MLNDLFPDEEWCKIDDSAANGHELDDTPKARFRRRKLLEMFEELKLESTPKLEPVLEKARSERLARNK